MIGFRDGRDWFFRKRFGMFIHWGIYSVNGWHEQEQYRLGLSREQYTPLMHKFNPAKFDPERWLDIFQEAGMGYVCFTAKHIDGFCMWDSAQTDFKITNTPYGRDILGMLAESCGKRDFPLCVYFSVPDMNCRYYPHSGKAYEFESPRPGDEPDEGKLMSFIKAQVSEICTNYGKISGFWWDGNAFWGQPFSSSNLMNIRDESINSHIRSMQPGIIINNRGFDEGDFSVVEREAGEAVLKESGFTTDRPVEACESVGRVSWGYRKNEDYYSPLHIKKGMLANLLGGGNYLLNAGPKPDGDFPEEALRIIKEAGSWYLKIRESVTGIDDSMQLRPGEDIFCSVKDGAVYLHFPGLKTSGVSLKPLDALPESAVLLNNGGIPKMELEYFPGDFPDMKRYLHIYDLPAEELAGDVAVVKLVYKKLPGFFRKER